MTRRNLLGLLLLFVLLSHITSAQDGKPANAGDSTAADALYKSGKLDEAALQAELAGREAELRPNDTPKVNVNLMEELVADKKRACSKAISQPPWRSSSQHFAHYQAQVEASHVNQLPFQNIPVPAQTGSPHATGFIAWL
jgi:hypothetical protein